jgi:hypothetical protein
MTDPCLTPGFAHWLERWSDPIEQRLRFIRREPMGVFADPALTPGFVHRGNHRPIESFYEPCADPSARSCCPRAVVVSSFEFVQETLCDVHGQRSGRVPD